MLSVFKFVGNPPEGHPELPEGLGDMGEPRVLHHKAEQLLQCHRKFFTNLKYLQKKTQEKVAEECLRTLASAVDVRVHLRNLLLYFAVKEDERVLLGRHTQNM